MPPVPRQGQGWIPASAVVRKLRSADKRSASFEASLREAPQDEEFHRAIDGIPHAEERPLGRVSKHADADAASILCSADFLTFGH